VSVQTGENPGTALRAGRQNCKQRAAPGGFCFAYGRLGKAKFGPEEEGDGRDPGMTGTLDDCPPGRSQAALAA